MNKNTIRSLWIVGIVLLVNFLSNEFFFRIDATKEKTYTLSQATREILRNLEEPVTVTSYFTSNLPPQYSKTLDDFKDLLSEYHTRSRGLVNFEFLDPNEDQETETNALQNGIQPLLINVREKDEVVQKKAFMGALLQSGERKEILPFISPEGPMEYELTTAIKKIAVADKPSVGFVGGHGEPTPEQMPQVYQQLSVLYKIETIDLNVQEIPAYLKTLVLLQPQDSIPAEHFAKIDRYLDDGGNVIVAFNSVTGNFQTVQGEKVDLGINAWLREKSIDIPHEFVLDATCGSISVQQNQGFFSFSSRVKFPYLPLINQFGEHPVTQGIDQAIFQFPSPINWEPGLQYTFTPLVQTSERSNIQPLPVRFDVQKQWTAADFPVGPVTIGALITGDFGQNGSESSLIVFSDGNFAMNQGGSANADNYNLLTNSVDFLSDDTGLIDLRTKGVASRPIRELEEGEKNFLKWLNFGLPILLVLALGIFIFQRNRAIRIRRMMERFQ
jgi:gliding-associated putative ABC transporter substrate-binding component GldG